MPKYEFDHIHLMSPDPMKTARVYEKIFGARVLSSKEIAPGMTIVNLDLKGTTVLISKQKDDGAATGLHHFGMRTDNLEQAAKELKAKGVNFTMDVTPISPGFKISFLQAPENVPIELTEGSM